MVPTSEHCRVKYWLSWPWHDLLIFVTMMMADGNASVNHDEQVISKSGSTREDWKQLWHTLHLSQSPRWSGFWQQLLLQCYIVTVTNFQFNVMKMIKNWSTLNPSWKRCGWEKLLDLALPLGFYHLEARWKSSTIAVCYISIHLS